MNINITLKRLVSLLICLSLIATSIAVITPTSYAGESAETTETASQEASSEETAPASGDVTGGSEGIVSNEDAKASKEKSNIDKIIAFAKKQTGKPYKYGSFGPKSFDCIGYVYYVFAKAGADLKTPMTKKKANNLKKNFSKYIVSYRLKDAKAGDIVVFYSGNKTKHAAIALGNGKGIWAHTKGGIKTGKLKGYGGCKVAIIRITK